MRRHVIDVAQLSMCGDREENQDVIRHESKDRFSYFSVCDGHGKLGKLAAETASKALCTFLCDRSDQLVDSLKNTNKVKVKEKERNKENDKEKEISRVKEKEKEREREKEKEKQTVKEKEREIDTETYKEEATEKDVTEFLQSCVSDAFQYTQNKVLDLVCPQKEMDIKEYEYGTTATVALFIPPDNLLVSWVGDSRAVIITEKAKKNKEEKENETKNEKEEKEKENKNEKEKKGEKATIIQLTNDHLPSNDAEAQRILSNGGKIIRNRNGEYRVKQTTLPKWPLARDGRLETSNGRIETSDGRMETYDGRMETYDGRMERKASCDEKGMERIENLDERTERTAVCDEKGMDTFIIFVGEETLTNGVSQSNVIIAEKQSNVSEECHSSINEDDNNSTVILEDSQPNTNERSQTTLTERSPTILIEDSQSPPQKKLKLSRELLSLQRDIELYEKRAKRKAESEALNLNLGMTRALGHWMLQHCGISFRPEHTTYKVQKGDILLLASDGVWGAIAKKDLEQIVNQQKNPDEIAAQILQTALEHQKKLKRVADNASVLVIKFCELTE